jgi:hypothetical protein
VAHGANGNAKDVAGRATGNERLRTKGRPNEARPKSRRPTCGQSSHPVVEFGQGPAGARLVGAQHGWAQLSPRKFTPIGTEPRSFGSARMLSRMLVSC